MKGEPEVAADGVSRNADGSEAILSGMNRNPAPRGAATSSRRKTPASNETPGGKRVAPKHGAFGASHGAGAADEPEDIREAVSRLKRERIISAAVDLFYTQGLSNTTLEAVAEKMNVTKPFIYAHFKSKTDLLAEICSRGISASLAALNRTLASEAGATEKLHALVRGFMGAVLLNQAHIAIYNREEKHLPPEEAEPINEMRREFDRKLSLLLKEGVRKGEFVVEDVNLCSLAIGGMVSWSYVWYRPEGRLSAEDTSNRFADMVVAMVTAKGTRARPARKPA